MYRVGKKQKRVILDNKGNEVAIFHIGNEKLAELTCRLLNEELKFLNKHIVMQGEAEPLPDDDHVKIVDNGFDALKNALNKLEGNGA